MKIELNSCRKRRSIQPWVYEMMIAAKESAGFEKSNGDLSFVRVEGMRIENFQLAGLTSLKSQFFGCQIESVDLSSATFNACSLSDFDMRSVRLTSSNWAYIRFESAQLKSCNLAKSEFFCSMLRGVTFVESNLRGAGFSCCDLRGANFSACEMEGASFTNCLLGEGFSPPPSCEVRVSARPDDSFLTMLKRNAPWLSIFDGAAKSG